MWFLLNPLSYWAEGRRRTAPAHLGERTANLKTYAGQFGASLSIIELTIIDTHRQRTSVGYFNFRAFSCLHVVSRVLDGK